MPTLTIAVANLKGGSGKTTSAAYLGHAFAARGLQVLLVDADPQGSLLRWSELAEWSTPTIGLPVKTLHTRLPGIVTDTTDIVIIDTPPLDEQAGIVHSAMRAADTVIITMAPSMVEFERLPRVFAAIEDIEPLRHRRAGVAVLFNRTVARANSTGTYRGMIEEDGNTVLRSAIPRREQYAQAFGMPITNLGAYADAATEILELGGTR